MKRKKTAQFIKAHKKLVERRKAKAPTCDLHPVIMNGLGTFEMLRRFGFTPDEIFSGWANGYGFAILRTQGVEFSIKLGSFDRGEDAWWKEWPAACELWNTAMPSDVRMLCFTTSEAYGNTISLLKALHAKGIVAPAPEAQALLF